MMTESEVQLAIYLEAVLRRRGYPQAADQLGGIVEHELDRRMRLSAPPPLRATG